MKRLWCGLIGLGVATLAGAGQRTDYGYEWPLQLNGEGGTYRIDLPAEVYAHISDANLRDLEVFNAQGNSVPFGPVPVVQARTAAVTPGPVTLPWFKTPSAQAQSAANAGANLHLVVERDADGRLRRLEADVPDAVDAAAAPDVLIDASILALAPNALELRWEPTGQDVSARFRVLGSNDLDTWNIVVVDTSIVELHQNGFDLVRRSIAIPAMGYDYFLLQRLDNGTTLALSSVKAGFPAQTPNQPVQERLEVDARYLATATKPQTFDYAAPGPLATERLSLQLASSNSVSHVQIFSRDNDRGYWQLRVAFTAFRVTTAGGESSNDDAQVDLTRDRQWRVVADPPLDRPPTLRLTYRPDRYALLTQGEAPFVLAAGSAVSRRNDYPMAELLAEVGSRVGGAWNLPQATIGEMRAPRGEEALRPRAPPAPVRQWVLWGILVLGAAAILFMVMRLLKSPPPPP